MWCLSVVLVAALGVVSCSASTNGQASGQNTAPEYAITQTGGSVVQTTVDGNRVYGPNVMLERNEHGLRGHGPLGVVDLRNEGESLRGIIGQWPTELHLEHVEGRGFRMRGMFSGILSSLEVTPERIQGQLGRCQYNLRRYESEAAVAYNGRRFCGANMMEPTTITLAPSINDLPPLERAAIITILLGR
jgi:hypothetical protein